MQTLREIGFLDIQLRFASAVSRVTECDIKKAMLDYTHLYFLLRCEGRFEPMDPTWRRFLQGFQTAPDRLAWAYSLYYDRNSNVAENKKENQFGCFSYKLWDTGDVRLHFRNREAEGVRPLAASRKHIRESELRALIDDLRPKVSESAKMIGGSWLYNIEAYRRLFPKSYLDTARELRDEHQFIAQWGQFVDSQGKLQVKLAEQFLRGIETATSLDELDASFPYPVMRLEAPLKVFYEW